LAREIVELSTHPDAARELGERGRREYGARFSPRVVAAQHDALYEELGPT
jgi:hypothetical protein